MHIKTLIQRPCYAMASAGEDEIEITMYGEIVQTRPKDWYTGEPVEGDFIIQDEFLKDLNDIVASGAKKVKIRLNSIGGDVVASIVIHNRLRGLVEQGVKIECVVDGVAMSGGSLIMCAADNVVVNPASLVMIHKCWTVVVGDYNSDYLKDLAKTLDAYDKSQVSIYKRKTQLSDTVILHLMSEETFMTGEEAIDKGFADEMVSGEALPIAASADRKALYVDGRRLAVRGKAVPENIPTISPEESNEQSPDASEDINTQPADNGENKEGETPMAKNLTELRAENPELAAEVEREIRAEMSASNDEALSQAVKAERKRLSEIDQIASSIGDDEIVREAKYGEQPCSAQDMAFRAALKAAEAGKTFMANAQADTNTSGVNTVQSAQAPAADPGEKKTEEQKQKEADAAFKACLEGGTK